MIIDDFYSHRFAYDKSEKIYILNQHIYSKRNNPTGLVKACYK